MKITRRFTQAGQSVYDLFEYTLRSSVLRNPDGSVVFEMHDIEVPKGWSQVATDIMAQKYFRKAGVPQLDAEGNPQTDESGNPVAGGERSAKQVVHRLAGCWTQWGKNHGYFDTEEDAQAFYDENAYILLAQMAAPNSPQWFNTGLNYAYGITGPSQGHYYVDPVTGKLTKSKDAYTHPQPHACARGNTRLFTSAGVLTIREIVENHRTDITVFDGDRLVPIYAVKNNGVRPVWRATLRNGNFIEFTDDHQIWSADRRTTEGGIFDWKPLREILGWQVQQAAMPIADQKEEKNEVLAVAAGEQSLNSAAIELQHILRNAEIGFSDDALFNNNDDFVQEYELDTTSYTANVPEKIFQGTLEEKRLFLRSLFQADGSVRIHEGKNSGDVVLSTISEELAHGVQILLLSVGIYSNVSVGFDAQEGRKPVYQISISYFSERIKYEQMIGFISSDKQQKICTLNATVLGEQKNSLSEELVTSIEYLGEEEVFDIQTESARFAANGVVVHNCFIQSVSDDLVNEGGIFDLITREARIFKYGSGCTSGDSHIYVSGSGFLPIRDLFKRFRAEGRTIEEFDGKGRFIDIADAGLDTLSIDEKTGAYSRNRIVRVWEYDVDKGDKITVKFDSGAHATVSAWHPFLVWDGSQIIERRADQLQRGDSIIGPNNTAAEAIPARPYTVNYQTTHYGKHRHHAVAVDADIAWLCGYFMGDGSLGVAHSTTTNTYGTSYNYQRLRLRFHDETEETLRRVQMIIERTFGAQAAIQQDGRGSKGKTLCYTSRTVTGFFAELFGVGEKTFTLRMPAFVWEAGRDVVTGFLAGLIDSDGWATDGRAIYVSASQHFVQEVATLASLYGFGGGIVRDRSTARTTILHRSALPEFRQELAVRLAHPERRRRLLEHNAPHERKFCMKLNAEWSAELFGDEHPEAEWLKMPVGAETMRLGRLRYGGIVNPLKIQRAINLLEAEQGEKTERQEYLERIARSVVFVTEVSPCTQNPDFYDLTVARHANYLAGEHGLVAIHNTGSNFSAIRAEGEPLSGGGVSSGLMSFLKVADRAAGAVKSGGTTRRAAKMVILNADHPDIETFIDWKMQEEQKVADLVAGSKVNSLFLNEIMQVAARDGSDFTEPGTELHDLVQRALNRGVPMSQIMRALALVGQGHTNADVRTYNTHYEGEAYITVSGQNSNNSVRVTNSFMDAVEQDGTWDLIRRTDGKTVRSIGARQLWQKINYAAWSCADPGLQFHTTVNEWHTSPKDGEINGSNPCSEYMFLDDTACNLASINLAKFYDAEARVFDVEGYKHACRILTIVLEVSVLMAQFPSKTIAQKSYDFRTLGLGYANIGTVLMTAGIPYDSEEGRAWAAALSAIMTGEAYAASAEMAGQLGPFPNYKRNEKDMLRVIRNHRRAAYNAPEYEYEGLTIKPMGINHSLCPTNLSDAAKETWDRALALGEQHGFRNAQVSVIAPTGTIALIMDCDTTGIEPDFAMVKFKKLAGGGYFKIVNSSVPAALRALGYSEAEIVEIERYIKGHGTLSGCPHINKQSLKEHGFSDEKIQAIENQLDSVFDVKFAFNKWTLGEEFLRGIGFAQAELDDPSLNILARLGFTSQQIEEANKFICGTMTIEGAPGLNAEHLPVFDCANKCGKYGQRYIQHMGHVKMMAAAQPFISGAISKTINMPNHATIEEVAHVYMESWKLMLKAIALYRDGSKLSQPLNSTADTDLVEEVTLRDLQVEPSQMIGEENTWDENVGAAQIHERIVEKVYHRADRRRLPKRRHGFVREATVGGHKVFIRTGEYEDGTLGEIFIDMYKEGASFKGLLNCFAVLASKALQYGMPLEKMVDTFTFTRFEPSGPVFGHEAIKSSTSIIDYVFRALGYEYLGREDFIHVKAIDEATSTEAKTGTNGTKANGNGNGNGHGNGPKLSPGQSLYARQVRAIDTPTVAPPVKPMGESQKKVQTAKAQGYTGEQCGNCGSMRVRQNGTCHVCEDCGTTSGCS